MSDLAGKWAHQHAGTDVYDDCCSETKRFDVRVDRDHRANHGHIWQPKFDGEWRQIWFRTSEEAWAYITGRRHGAASEGER